MKTRGKLFLFSAALSIGAVACGNNDTKKATDANVSIDAKGFDAKIITPDADLLAVLDPVCNATDGVFVRFVDKIFQCNPGFKVILGGKPTPGEIEVVCKNKFGDFVLDGSAVMNTDLSACLAYIKDTSCVSFDTDVHPCSDVMRGTLAIGSDCDGEEQCLNGYCEEANEGENCGKCVAEIVDGQNCDIEEWQDCASDYCNSVGKCAPKGGISDNCGAMLGTLVDGSEPDEDCQGNLICSDEGSCILNEPSKVDDTCELEGAPYNGACGFPGSGLFCANISNTGLCKKTKEIGQACDSIAICHVLEHQWCNQGTCAMPNIVAARQTCKTSLTEQAIGCEQNYYCKIPEDSDTGVCHPWGQEGDTCDDSLNERCAIFLDCEDNKCIYNTYTGTCSGKG